MANFALSTTLITLLIQIGLIMAPTITYSRLELLGLMPSKCHLPLSTFTTLKELQICGVQPTQRGTRGGKIKHVEYRPTHKTIGPIENNSTVNTNKTFNLSLWNSQSACNKTVEICDYVIDRDIDVLCLTETWMQNEDQVVIGELSPPNYAFINVPRVSANDHQVVLASCINRNLTLVKLQILTFEIGTTMV